MAGALAEAREVTGKSCQALPYTTCIGIAIAFPALWDSIRSLHHLVATAKDSGYESLLTYGDVRGGFFCFTTRTRHPVDRIFLGRYEPVRLLGQGGMGQVYLARQHDLARYVVVKVMHERLADDPDFRRRFEQETLLLASFEHPLAVRLYDASLDDPQGPCMVLEYLRGITLEALLKANGRKLHPARVDRLLGPLCEVLQAAHEAGIVHRDLKPANIMITDADTPSEKMKVMDFGLAVLQNEGNRNQAAGRFAGTPYYVSPEQARGERVDHRSDLYSVGVLLYQMLVGRIPFSGQTIPDVLLAHVHEPPPAFDNGDISAALEEVVRSCLAKDPADRPASAEELFEHYHDALLHGDNAAPTDPDIVTATAPDLEPITVDPKVLVYRMRASMNRTIAEHKLRGFIEHSEGVVLQSVPGLVQVHLGVPGTIYAFKTGLLSWLGLSASKGLEAFVYLRPAEPQRPDVQELTVLMRSLDGHDIDDPRWRAHCNWIYNDLRGYLMGQDVTVPV